MDTKELTKKGFAKLNLIVNSTGGLHPLDEDAIKGFIKAVYDNGDELDIDLLEQLASQNKWRATAIDFMITKAHHVANGGNVQLKHNKDHGATMYQRIIDEANQS